MEQLSQISRLQDGRLFARGRTSEPKVLQGGEWVSAKGVMVADVWQAKPLRSSDIATLRSKGVLPQ
ncbi:MAG: hypothetical protein ACYSSP_05575 [Planctomycetota bacterium]